MEKIAVCKSYNVNRHYTTKHAVSYDKFKGQFRIDKIELLKKTFPAQQSVMKTKVISSYSATKMSFLMAEAIAKSGKPFCTGDLLKNCLKIFCKEICPEKTPTVEDLSLSHQTIARRVEDLSKNIELSLKEKLNKCEAYSLALDESTDRGDTAQLAIFIRGIKLKLQGKDQLISKLFENVETFVLKLKLLKQQLSSKVLVHFKALSERNINTIDSERYCTLILKLIDEFDTRFCDFKKKKMS